MSSRFLSSIRVPLVIAVAALAFSACSGSDSIPKDQGLQPVSTPSGWTTTALAGVKVSAPAEWTKGETKQATATMKTTTWRAAEVEGIAPGGMEVRVISKPQQNAKKAALALSLSASATLQGGNIDPEQITWPNAELAYFYSTVITAGLPGKESKFASSTSVFDLADGRQIQVTSLVKKGSTQADPTKVLGTIKLPKTSK